MEYLDIQSGEWRYSVSLQLPRSGAVAVELYKKIVVIGGRSTREVRGEGGQCFFQDITLYVFLSFRLFFFLFQPNK